MNALVVDTDIVSFLFKALLHDIPLITHNRNDYRGVQGLSVNQLRLTGPTNPNTGGCTSIRSCRVYYAGGAAPPGCRVRNFVTRYGVKINGPLCGLGTSARSAPFSPVAFR
jgi:hypothetical protein